MRLRVGYYKFKPLCIIFFISDAQTGMYVC